MPTVIAPHGCYLVALSDNVENGQAVEVDDETARSLIEQGWQPAPESESKAPRARTKPAVEAESEENR